MPELPEVETVRAGLASFLVNGIIFDVQKFRDNLRYDFPKDLTTSLLNVKILNIKRRAKYLLFELSNGSTIISHLGMSGSWNVYGVPNFSASNIKYAKHDHLILFVKKQNKNIVAIYNDPRRFGFILNEKTENLNKNKFLGKLGVEPLSDDFNAKYLYEKFCKKNLSFKAALLDQTIISGLGNIYVCEALWRSNISPFSKVNDFCKKLEQAPEKLKILCDNIKQVLKEALNSGGSTLKDYKKIDGTTGYFQHNFSVYGKVGNKCIKCNTIIEKATQNGRSSFFCAVCQPLLNEEI